MIMDIAMLIISIFLPVATVLLALVVQMPLSALLWRGFLKLSSPGSTPIRVFVKSWWQALKAV
jgi:uncharacterized membrane protein YjjB (DUF3815 family)